MVRITPFPPPHSGLSAVALLVFSLVVCLISAGCEVVAIEEEQPTGADLNQTVFETDVMPVLITEGCANVGCHDFQEGSGGAFRINAAADDENERLANFISAKSFANINDPPNSKLLLEPLAGVLGLQGTHGGGDIFESTTEAGYQTILQWISTPDFIAQQSGSSM